MKNESDSKHFEGIIFDFEFELNSNIDSCQIVNISKG